jgi:undecaprenyl-diphosphatase
VRGNLSAFNDFIYSKISPSISPILTNGLIFISHMGEWYVYGSITILLLLIPKTRKKWGIPVALTISGSAVLNQVLKHFFAIPRPDINRLVAVSGYGYPSGHAMNAMAFVGICLFLFLRA